MQQNESVADLARLADAFDALAADASAVMVDRETQAPADAVGWPARRNFRVRLRRHTPDGQASAYYQVGDAGLELMMATNRSGPGAGSAADAGAGAADGVWGSVRVPAGEEPQTATLVLQQLRRRVG